jgi:hypothetical protein
MAALTAAGFDAFLIHIDKLPRTAIRTQLRGCRTLGLGVLT